MLKRIESTLAAIKTKLSADKIIKQLLVHDGNDALEVQLPEGINLDKYITLKPVFEFENKEDYNQNSIVNIYMTEAQPNDGVKAVDATIQINVICNESVWELIDNKIRPLRIANRIIELVNETKFTASNKMVLNGLTELIINKKMYGYALLFELTDGSGEIDKF